MSGVRTRGGCRGRGGVRTRGGSQGGVGVVFGGLTEPAEVAEVAPGPAEAPQAVRGRRRGRGRARWGRKKRRPAAKEEVVVLDLEVLPLDAELERENPPTNKRKRSWSPARSSSRTPSPPLAPECGSPSPTLMDIQGAVLSPALALELGGGTPPASVAPWQAWPVFEGGDIEALNFGSESESGEDSDEDDSPAVPRVLRAIMDTPEDEDESAPPQQSLPLPSLAAATSMPPPDTTSMTPVAVTSMSPPDATSMSPVAATSMSPADATSTPPPAATSMPPPAVATPSSTVPVEPTAFLDFKWRPFPNPPVPSGLRREVFSKINVGPTVPHADPYDVFVCMWDRQFMEHIASETNKYAQQYAEQLFQTGNLQPGSRICEWKDTSADELYVFFAILAAMGIVVIGRLADYWSANPSIFMTPGFHVYMSLRRFQLISKCLHFRDNKDMYTQNLSRSEAKLYKIQPVLDHLNDVFQSSYNPRQNIALDESLLQWKGWLDVNQFAPNNAAAVAIKSYEVCESQTGYLWRFLIHAQKRTETAAPNPLQTFPSSLVLGLLQGLEYTGHTVWMDNFYNSPALARKLKSLGIDCVGTLRTNRQFVPAALTNLSKRDMLPGQIVGLTSGDVDLMVWRDRNRVAAISTYHGNSTVTTRGVTKPLLIHDYNVMMGSVDKKDQMLAAYPLERKRTRVWYKKLFRRLLNASILNSYIICKYNNPSKPHRDFRISLIQSLLRHHSPHVPSVPTALPRVGGPEPSVPTVYDHHLVELPYDAKLKGRMRRRCVVCKKRVTTECAGCGKAACMKPCFVSMH